MIQIDKREENMIEVNIYHQKNIGEHSSKEDCTLVASLKVEKMSLRLDFDKCKNTEIKDCRKTDEGDIIEIMPFENCRICEIGQFEVSGDAYRRID